VASGASPEMTALPAGAVTTRTVRQFILWLWTWAAAESVWLESSQPTAM
jgi:hypothetical protein